VVWACYKYLQQYGGRLHETQLAVRRYNTDVMRDTEDTEVCTEWLLLHAIARLSVTWVDQSKTVEVRIMQLSPQSSPVTNFLVVKMNTKFQREHRERGRQIN